METDNCKHHQKYSNDIPVIKVETSDNDHSYGSSLDSKCYNGIKKSGSSVGRKKSPHFHSCFLRKLSQNKIRDVNSNRLLLADPKTTIYWSNYLTRINLKFPNIIQTCHISKASFDEVNN